MVSSIIHMLRSDAPWRDSPIDYAPPTRRSPPLQSLEAPECVGEILYVLSSKSDVGTGAVEATYVKAHRSAGGAKWGAFDNAIGASRSGRATKTTS